MNKLLTILLCFGLVGCTTVGSVIKNASSVNHLDGIDVQEARWLAQKHCLDTKECKGFIISRGKISDGDSQKVSHNLNVGKWIIYFNHFLIVMIIEIDKKTGEVQVRWDSI